MDNHLIRALKVKPFLFLWLAEVFSQVAANMMNFILILVVFSLTSSNIAVSGIVLSFTIPAILFGTVAGVFVDRWDKKKVLLYTNIIRAACAFLLAIFHTNLLLVYVLSFIMTVATQFFIPAETPIIPLVVKKELLFSANALFGLALYGSLLIAYAVSGPLLLALGTMPVILVLAGCFSLACVFVLCIKEKKLSLPKEKLVSLKHVMSETKYAVSLILKTKSIYHSFLFLTLSQILILVISVIGPGYAKEVLGIKIDAFPLLFVTPATLGMVCGAVLITNYLHNRSKDTLATTGLFLLAFAVLLLPFGSKVTDRTFIHSLNIFLPHILQITILHMMVVLAFIMGVGQALIFVPSNIIIQEKTSDEERGKVYGALNAMAALFSLFPVILAGSLADMFGVRTVLVVIGLVMAILGGMRLRSTRKVVVPA